MSDAGQKQVSLETVTCLIVDDDKFSRTFAKTALYQIGIKNVKEVGSAEEAKEMVNTSKIDVILLDQQMPQESGLEFAKELKNNSHEEVKNIPIIMITVDTKEQTVLNAKSLGIHEYLVKPISPMALKKRICSAIEAKHERI